MGFSDILSFFVEEFSGSCSDYFQNFCIREADYFSDKVCAKIGSRPRLGPTPHKVTMGQTRTFSV